MCRSMKLFIFPTSYAILKQKPIQAIIESNLKKPRSQDYDPNRQFGSRKRCLNRALTIYHNRNHHAPNIWSMEVVKRSATASLQTLPKVVLVKCLWTIKLRLHCLCVKDSRQILLTTDETMYLQWQPFEQMFHVEMIDTFKEFDADVLRV